MRRTPTRATKLTAMESRCGRCTSSISQPTVSAWANSDHQFDKAGIAYDRLEAVDGWELTDDEIARVYDEAANRRRARYPLVRPEIGLYLSQINAWKHIAAGSADGGFVFEDDFAAAATLADVLNMLSADSADWDMVKLYARKPAPYTISRRPLGAPARDSSFRTKSRIPMSRMDLQRMRRKGWWRWQFRSFVLAMRATSSSGRRT